MDLDALARQVQAAQDDSLRCGRSRRRFPVFDLPAAYAVAGRIHQARLTAGWSSVRVVPVASPGPDPAASLSGLTVALDRDGRAVEVGRGSTSWAARWPRSPTWWRCSKAMPS